MSRTKQASLLDNLTRMTKFCKKLPGDVTEHQLKARYDNLIVTWEAYKTNQDGVEALCANDSELKIQFSNREQAEEYYYFCYAEIKNHLEELSSEAQPQVQSQPDTQFHQQEIRMPPVNIPVFNGEYENWPAFSDHFTKLVHDNTKLINIQKLHHLKANVIGEAADLIREFKITDSNYTEAWNTLLNRYNNKRFIIDNKLDAFIDYPCLTFESGTSIKNLLDMANRTVTILKSIGVEIGDCMLVHLLVRKLDKETRKQWELTLTRQEMPTFKDITTFLDNRWQSLERVPESSTTFTHNKNMKNKSTFSSEKHHSFVTNITSQHCVICKKNHKLFMCPIFKNMPHDRKIEIIKQHKLCFNCLRTGHSIQQCSIKVNCRHCNKRHHSSIHNNNSSSNTTSNSTSAIATTAASEQSSSTNVSNEVIQSHLSITKVSIGNNMNSQPTPQSNMLILLATALVNIKAPSGKELSARALIDSGSQVSFITESLSQRLGLKKHSTRCLINGIGHTDAGEVTSRVQFTLLSRVNSTFSIQIFAYTMKRITGSQPQNTFPSSSSWKHLENLNLADPKFNVSGNIDILLGADVFTDLILDGRICGPTLPHALNSQLGWILSGKVIIDDLNVPLNQQHIYSNHVTIKPLTSLEKSIKKFWEIEELVDIRQPSLDEEICEQLFYETCSRNEKGRYIVTLPFKSDSKPLGNSRKAAIARLLQMEKKFANNSKLFEQYASFMKEYLELGHMELVPNPDSLQKNRVFYLPHHAVLKESSSSTKLRVVFDGSCKSSSGVSLNDNLLVGPTIQDPLMSILLRWRKHKIVLLADIEKMYRQIQMADKDSDLQRIVWRFSKDEPIKDYRLTTVTYGTSSAAFLAIRSLRQLADDEKTHYPEASKIVLNDFYVDDMMTGSDSIDDAVSLQKSLNTLLRLGGFELKKWCSNNIKALQDIPSEHCQIQHSLPIMEDSIKTLGVFWNPSSDSFEFKVTKTPFPNSTKRNMLSDIAKLFDPLGWFAPVTILAKIMLQKLWLLGISWDADLPEDITKKWLTYRNELSDIQNIKIPRWIGFSNNIIKFELHGFADASNAAYAAVVFSRVVLQDETIIIRNLGSKTKVAPLHTISLARLELCAAVLLAKLIHKVKNSLQFPQIALYAWSDSMIALAWIYGLPNRWKTFVANRVTELQKYTSPDIWSHISSLDNPADCASRGILPSELKSHPLWWTGPLWLALPQERWPEAKIFSTKEEVKSINIAILNPTNYCTYLHTFSSLNKLVRITALCRRFIFNCKTSHINRTYGIVSITEMENTLIYYVKSVQSIDFKDEISKCKLKADLPRRSPILPLKPFMHLDILRVGGRLSKSNLPFSMKHPIILSKSNPLSNLIISQAHADTLHGGPQLMMSHIRRKYWITGVKDLARSFVRRCIICFRFNAKAHQQIMADLPAVRVNAARPFLHSGMDFAGPITTKMYPGRCKRFSKGYVCLFVCLATKALHIEYVSDLSSNAFIAAFKRFTSRRGKCLHLYSDNGTNFVGASSELKKLFIRSTKSLLPVCERMLQDDGTTFHFIPPSSPHFGGLWEAGVKSIKHHLRRIIGTYIFTFEEMTTILTQIEAALNSRPLCPLSNEPDDMLAITPGHFLIGEPPTTVPEPSLLDCKSNSLDRWQLVQKQYQSFWAAWSNEYLSRLQQRPKWLLSKRNINKGDLVLVHEDNLPPSKWLLARVIDTHPDSAGKVRVVSLRSSKNHNFKRPIVKLSILPIHQPDDNCI